MSSTTPTTITRSLLIYDGDCGFCTSSANWLNDRVLRKSGSIAQWQSLDLDLYGLSVNDVTSASWWVDNSGELHRGERGFAKLLIASGLPWSIPGQLIGLPGISAVAGVVYGLIAKNRHRLPGATAACRIDI